MLRGRDTELFLASSTALMGVGGALALMKGYVLFLLLTASVPFFIFVVHANVVPVLALPMVGAILLFGRATRPGESGGAGEGIEEFTAVVPVKDDASVLRRCVDSLLTHPGARVLVVYERDTVDGTDVEARRLAEQECRVSAAVNPPRHSGSKAGALNHALDVAETEIVAVFDADHEARAGSISRALHRFARDPELVHLSGRTVKRETDLLGKVGYGESLLFHQVPSFVLDRLFGFHMTTTTNCFFRRDALRSVGGFDPDVLTEDMDLGVRLFTTGNSMAFDPSIVSVESSARSVRDWWGQKKRWIRGSLEVSRKNHLRPLLERPGLAGLFFTLTLLVIPFMYPVTVLISGFLLVNLFTGGVTALLPLSAPGLLVAYLARGDAKRGYGDGASPLHLLSPFFLMLASFVGLKAVCEELAGEEVGWYKVSR